MHQRKRLDGIMFMASMLSTPTNTVEVAKFEFEEPNQDQKPNDKNQSISMTQTKDGYTCKISGMISYFNMNSKIKNQKNWLLTCERWFQNTPIEQVISKPFVTILIKP